LRKVPLKPYWRGSPVIEMEVTIRRLATTAVRDTVSGQANPAGPDVDEDAAWRAYCRSHPDRRYAVGKRQLARKELRRHGLTNAARGT
jgi:hypothetical protein